MKSNSISTPTEQWQLLSYVLKFADGTLYRIAKELNNEKKDSFELKD